MKRKDKMRKLKDQGLTYQAIATMYKLSRARVHQIISGYDSNRTNYRKSILIRDNYKCQWGELCKSKETPINKLVVHHIDFDNNNNSPSNLITLCRKCHSKFHSENHINDEVEKRLLKRYKVKKR